MRNSLFLLCVLLGCAASQYVESQWYSSDYASMATYPSAAREKDLVPAGSKISKLWVSPTYESSTDFVVGGMGFCYAQVSNGNYSAEVCIDRPCWINAWYQSLCPVRHSLDLAVDEYVISAFMYFNPSDIALCHLEFTTNKGNHVGAGSWFVNSQERPTTYTVPAGAELAGFYTENYIAMETISFFTRNGGVCGDGIVQDGEQCDMPSSVCCTSTCQFAAATTTCRSVQGLCDVAETCTGTSAVCPADAYLPAATPCGEFFGMCDVQLEKSCSGTSPQCFPTPATPATTTTLQVWTGFNVISFNGFTCSGGDVEGRLAARNFALLSGFNLGLELNTSRDGFQPYSIYSAGNVTWSTGSMHPAGAMGFSASFTGPDYLASLFTEADATLTGAAFDSAQAYYTQIQVELSGLATNADATLQYGDGLLITCTERSDVYHMTVDDVTFNQVNWYSTSGCKFSARWIIDITGTSDVSFKGEPFPGIVERVIYNILGSGRIISANNGIAGHILSPQNSYTQTQGVTYGKVVVGDVIEARQNNKPNCIDFMPVSISLSILKPVSLGDKVIYVADLSDIIIGDRICVEGNCQIVTSGNYVLLNGEIAGVVNVDGGFDIAAASGFAKVLVENPNDVTRETSLAVRPTETTSFNFDNGSCSLSASLALVALLALVN